MTLVSLAALGRAVAVTAAPRARRSVATMGVKSMADITRLRASLPVVKQLQEDRAARPIDIAAALKQAGSCDSHFGYEAVSRVLPLVFGWTAVDDCKRQLALEKIPAGQLPSSQFSTPMITAIDYVNENVSGHPGLIHGGMTTVIAHSVMSLLAALNAPGGADVVSRSLNMDYRRPIRTGDFVKVHAWVYRREQERLDAAVQFHSMDGTVLVEATSGLDVYPR
ncbi:hypothetical protein GGF46_003873 [Coemansia sp. RSA 552]|nr:hypothetical protein GGF46_003873 [Coemansia sp. RSA 552]